MRCCHGDFAESNPVFTPIVGGTSKKDIESGHPIYLRHPGLSPSDDADEGAQALVAVGLHPPGDAVERAEVAVKTDEVYGVLAYILSLGDIVPADFTLSDRNIAEVQERLPNRFGHVFERRCGPARAT